MRYVGVSLKEFAWLFACDVMVSLWFPVVSSGAGSENRVISGVSAGVS